MAVCLCMWLCVCVCVWDSDTKAGERQGGITWRDDFQGQAHWEMWLTLAVSASHAPVCVFVCVALSVSKSFLVTESAHRLYDPSQWDGLLHHHHTPPAHNYTDTHSHTICASFSPVVALNTLYAKQNIRIRWTNSLHGCMHTFSYFYLTLLNLVWHWWKAHICFWKY